MRLQIPHLWHRASTRFVTSNSAGLGLAIMFFQLEINLFNFVCDKVRAIYTETTLGLRTPNFELEVAEIGLDLWQRSADLRKTLVFLWQS